MREYPASTAGIESSPVAGDDRQDPIYEQPIFPSCSYTQSHLRRGSWVSEFSVSTSIDSFSSSSSRTKNSSQGHSLTAKHCQSSAPSRGESESTRSSVNSSVLSKTSFEFGFWKVKFLRAPSVFTVNRTSQSDA